MGKLGGIFGRGKDKTPKPKKSKKASKTTPAQEPILNEEPVIKEDLLEVPKLDAIDDINLDEDLLDQIDADLEDAVEDAPETQTDTFEPTEEFSIEPELNIKEQAEDVDFAASLEESPEVEPVADEDAEELSIEPELNTKEQSEDIDIFAEAETDNDLNMNLDDNTPGIAAIDDIVPDSDSDDFFADIETDMLDGDNIEVTAAPEIAEPQPTNKPDKKAKKVKKVKEPKVKKTKKVKPPKPVKVKAPKARKQKQVKLPAKIANPEVIAESDYGTLLKRIMKISKKLRSVAFGGAGIDTLPVTIPVNIAMQLAKSGKKCLLIDLDLKRNAVASAFGIEEEKKPMDFLPRPYDTSVENLKVWPAHNFTKRRYVSIPSLVDAAVNKYDYVLLNAPYLDGHLDRSQIGLAAASALIFTQNEKQTTRLYNLLTSCNCKIIGNIQIKA